MENDVVLAEPTIAEMRAMLDGSAAPAGTETVAKTDTPASEPEAAQETSKSAERGPDGKFQARAEDAPAEDTTPVPPGVQKRIDKAVKAQREAERRLAEAEAKLKGPQESRPATENAPPAAAAAAKEPKAEDYASYEEYTRAIARYEIEREVSRQREETEKATREQAQLNRHREFDAAEAEFRKTTADYDDVTSSIEWPKTPAMAPIADYLLDTKNAALMYQLGKQPAELARIAALSPVLAIAELGKFEAKLTAGPASPAAKALPRPPANVGGSASAQVADINDPDISMGEFKRLMHASLSRK